MREGRGEQTYVALVVRVMIDSLSQLSLTRKHSKQEREVDNRKEPQQSQVKLSEVKEVRQR